MSAMRNALFCIAHFTSLLHQGEYKPPDECKTLTWSDKEEYYRQLYSLNDSSDEEIDTNEARDVFRQSKPAQPAFFPTSPALRSSPKRDQPAAPLRKAPTIHRTTSAPVSSKKVVQETPNIRRKFSLLRHDISSQDITSTSSSRNTPPGETSNTKPIPERSASTPNIGSVVMNNSKGIAAMLGKRTGESLAKATTKKKATKAAAKRDVVNMVPEARRFLSGKTIFWIPDNDIFPLRKKRIEKAREFGAVWTKEWTPDVTHVIVDNDLSHQAVIDFLSPTMKSKMLPRHITLVNENYVVECVQFQHLLDPDQRKYYVKGYKETINDQEASPPDSQASETSLQLKAAKPRKGDHVPERTTQSQSQSSTQEGIYYGPVEIASRVSLLMPNYHREIEPTPTPPSLRNTPPESIMGKRGDILDEWIDLARKIKDLPLDDEGDEGEERPPSRSTDDPEESGESERERARSRKPKKKCNKYAMNKLDSFVCMHGGTGKMHGDNPNRLTIDILQNMGDYYDRIGEVWRPRAYRNAIGTLKKLKVHVESYEDAIRLPFIGERLAKKIEEISITGHLRRLDNALSDPSDKTLQLFLKIYGVGLSQAHQWIQAGHKTLEDLCALPDLHKNQRLGIEHYSDFDTRIPRNEVRALGDIVIQAAAEIDPQVEAIIGGSYRRGADTSGDIDFIITRRNTSSCQELLSFLETLVSRLTRDGFLVAPLAVPKSSGSKWHGACVLPGNPVWRRIDFLVVPQTELGAALLYFTGDDIFNRSMRLLASKKGMRLNQRGLYKDVLRTFGREKLTEGTLVEGADERAIFDWLGVPWRPPHERICR